MVKILSGALEISSTQRTSLWDSIHRRVPAETSMSPWSESSRSGVHAARQKKVSVFANQNWGISINGVVSSALLLLFYIHQST
jgi:hypothetical protein